MNFRLLLLITLLCPVLVFGQTFTNYPIMDAEIAFEAAHVETPDGVWVTAVYAYVIGEGNKVYIVRSFDNGITWLEDTVYADMVDPTMCLDGNGDILMVLQHATFGGTILELYRSSDNGDHFTYITSLPASGFGDKPWIISDDSGHVYATWTSMLFGNNVIGFARSDDNCATWTDMFEFSDPTYLFLTGSFLCVGQDGKLYMTWGESASGNIYMSKSSNWGESWTEPLIISEMMTKDYSPMTYCFAAPNSDYIGVLASIAHYNFELLYIWSDNGGADWHTELIDTMATNPSGIMQHNENMHVIYNHFPGTFDTGYSSEMRYITRTPDTEFSDPLVLEAGDADLIYSTYIGEYAQAHIGDDSELHSTWIRKTTDIGFTHTIIDIPEDTSIIKDTTTTALLTLPSPVWYLYPNPAHTYVHIAHYDPKFPVTVYTADARAIPFTISNQGDISLQQAPKGMLFIEYQNRIQVVLVE